MCSDMQSLPNGNLEWYGHMHSDRLAAFKSFNSTYVHGNILSKRPV